MGNKPAKPEQGTFLTVAASDEEITRARSGSVKNPRDLVGWRVRVHEIETDQGEEGVRGCTSAVHEAWPALPATRCCAR